MEPIIIILLFFSFLLCTYKVCTTSSFIYKVWFKYSIRIAVIDGPVGSGKSSLIRLLCGNVNKSYHPIVGVYYVDRSLNYMYIEEPLHLLMRNGLLKLSMEHPNRFEDLFQLSASHILHVHLNNVLQIAVENNVRLIVMERHITTVYHVFGESVKERFPNIELYLMNAYHLAIEDITARYRSILHNGTLLHGCIYLKWASHREMTENIVKRGRDMELKALSGELIYPFNRELEVKQKQMLEILNVPTYYVHKKTGEIKEIMVFLKHILND